MEDVWAKLYEYVDLSEWDKLSAMNLEVREILAGNCEEQLNLFENYLKKVNKKDKTCLPFYRL